MVSEWLEVVVESCASASLTFFAPVLLEVRMASEVWTLRDQSAEVLTVYATNGQRTSGAWQWKEDYVYRGRALLATATAASGLLHISVDHFGTPRATTNAAGVLVTSRHYWGYGQDLGTGGADPETKRFTGHERDLRLDGTADDLDYMHARYYSPMWGRFLSVDPARSQDQKKPLGWNRYGYALDNPLGYVDPDGNAPLDPSIATFLGDSFGQRVSAVKTYGGAFSRGFTKLLGAEAVTVGQSVFFGGRAWQAYEERSIPGIALTAHEVRHTLQYKELGIIGFLLKYTWQGIKALGNPYRMPLEAAGYHDQAVVRGLLGADPSLLRQIQSGSSVRATMQPSSSGWFTVDRSNPGIHGSLNDFFGFGGNLWLSSGSSG